MSNYSKTTDFEAKDSLPTGDSGKIIRGAEFETEFDAISTAIATKADTAGPTFTGTLTFETISDGTIGVTAFVDEDDMSSDSATLVPTQQSVKAYVDSQVTAQDLDFQADTGGALSIDLDSETLTFTGGTGIDTSGSGNAVTFAIDSTVATLTGTQTLTNKTLTAPTISGNLTTDGTIDGRDVATDGAKLDGIESGATADQTAAEIRTLVESATDSNVFTDADHSKLDGIEASADVTDTANVTAAGALMDSELTSEASVKALNQGVATTDSPTFAGVTVNGTVEFDGLSGTGSVNVTDILDQDDMSSNSATALATQQSIKAYVDSQVATADTLSEVLANGNTTGGTDIAVGTGDDITFADSSKAIFGAGSDLQIYHSGSASFIDDAGVGDLNLRAYNDLNIKNINNDNIAVRVRLLDGSEYVELHHAGSTKLSTTSTGIDVTGVITTDGMTTSADINFGDNDKAIFGAGSDLQIYHDASNSYISDVGTGKLILKSNGTATLIQDSAGGAQAEFHASNKTVKLFYDNSLKLETTSTGIDVTGVVEATGYLAVEGTSGNTGTGTDRWIGGDGTAGTWFYNVPTGSNHYFAVNNTNVLGVNSTGINVTGTVTADGLTVDSNATISSAAPVLNLTETDTTNLNTLLESSSGNLNISTRSDDGGTKTKRMRITHATGDISFYEDTGTTPKLFWDASAESLFIGATSASALNTFSDDLIVSNTAAGTGAGISIVSNATNGYSNIHFGDTDDADIGRIQYNNTDNKMTFRTNTSDALTIDSSQNVGIGTSSPSAPLNVVAGSNANAIRMNGRSSDNYSELYASSNDGSTNYSFLQGHSAQTKLYTLTSTPLLLGTNSTEAMRIDSSGQVGIGTSSPQELLHLSATTPVFRLEGGSRSYQQFVSGTDFVIRDVTATANRITLNSSGNVGIGTSSPSKKLHVKGTGSTAAMMLESSSSSNGQLVFKNTSTTNNFIVGLLGDTSGDALLYHGDAKNMQFWTNNTERMRIDSSGNLLVGQTTAYTGAGVTISGDGVVQAERNNISGVFNRTSTDGEIVQFRKDGTTVGSIQSRAGVVSTIILDPRSGQGAGLTGAGAGGDTLRHITPTNESGTEVNGKVSLGNSNNGFKDIYLSGGVVFGSTGGTRHKPTTLDDYEEGTWTPALWQGTHTYSSQVGRYVKIGKMVTVWGEINISSRGSSTSELGISGLPFASSGSASAYASVLGIHSAYGSSPLLPTGVDPTGVSVESTSGYFRSTHSTNASYNINELNSSGQVTFAFTYEAT